MPITAPTAPGDAGIVPWGIEVTELFNRLETFDPDEVPEGDGLCQSWTPGIKGSDGSTVNLGSTGVASGKFAVAGDIVVFHNEYVAQGSGISFGTGSALVFELPVLGRDPTADSPVSHDYMIGSGMIGRVFGLYDSVGEIYIDPNPPSGFTAGKCCRMLIGGFGASDMSAFVASTTKNVAHGLGIAPHSAFVQSESQSTGLLTCTKDATNIAVTAANSTSAAFAWRFAMEKNSDTIVAFNYPFLFGTALDHIELAGFYFKA